MNRRSFITALSALLGLPMATFAAKPSDSPVENPKGLPVVLFDDNGRIKNWKELSAYVRSKGVLKDHSWGDHPWGNEARLLTEDDVTPVTPYGGEVWVPKETPVSYRSRGLCWGEMYLEEWHYEPTRRNGNTRSSYFGLIALNASHKIDGQSRQTIIYGDHTG